MTTRTTKVKTLPAPSGMKDTEGRAVRILYNLEDAPKHCQPKHLKKKTRPKPKWQ